MNAIEKWVMYGCIMIFIVLAGLSYFLISKIPEPPAHKVVVIYTKGAHDDTTYYYYGDTLRIQSCRP